jgi:hypothetical protein
MFLLILLSIVMLLILIGLFVRRLPGNMPLVGCNSKAIAAACQVSPVSTVDSSLYRGEKKDNKEKKQESSMSDSQRQAAEGAETGEVVLTDQADLRVKISQCLLKWGVVPMTPEWHAMRAVGEQDGCTVVHLSFGTILDDVRPPAEGEWCS